MRWKRLIPFVPITIVVFALAKLDQHTGSRFHDWAEGWSDDAWFQALGLIGLGFWIALGIYTLLNWVRRKVR